MGTGKSAQPLSADSKSSLCPSWEVLWAGDTGCILQCQGLSLPLCLVSGEPWARHRQTHPSLPTQVALVSEPRQQWMNAGCWPSHTHTPAPWTSS